MPKQNLETQIHLPPDIPSSAGARELLSLLFNEFQWFAPSRYGDADLSEPVPSGKSMLDVLMAYYEEHGHLCVAARTDQDYLWLFPCESGPEPYHGSIIWVTSAAATKKAAWRAAHTRQVLDLMHLVQSPLALSTLEEDFKRKTQRLVPEGIGLKRIPTVRDYSEGLPGLVWRNFYGPPFVRMFGQRLEALPTGCHTPLGDDIVLVQPYELPTEAGTEAGMARERELISLLGPECFYDHEHHTLPSRRPILDALGQAIH
ncbi:hypothetical protein ATI61_109173 [Archangium gephyra]|uniref:Uncharacterized protein n=1 Tax=Archangium gephyra TaxID=48 RepID=A0AAC8Q3A5_9BACT|nr:hypothetical protein [Archangium gephyra]AKI99633.1 Hypothetical protein AA314_01260 [Archangium gephyra]REG27836.1 hypothetical protein ATI61_109173 [Archangium gephyra]